MNRAAFAVLEAKILDAFADLPVEARRLFHGRGRQWQWLEQITVDWLQGVVLVSLFREPDEAALAELVAMLKNFAGTDLWRTSGAQHLLLQHRYLPDSRTEYLIGDELSQGQISEDGLHYLLDFGRKQNTGLFLDMRMGRQWLREHANGASVLNLFAYTCGFSVAAIAGGAAKVVNLDMSRPALNRGRENHRLNQQDVSKVSFLGHDLFNSWGKVRKEGPYDVIVVDPPSFQKGSFILSRDYAKIMRRLPDLLTEQGQALICCNDPAISSAFLRAEMQREAPQLVFAERLANPPEFVDVEPEAGLKVLRFVKAASSVAASAAIGQSAQV